MSQLTTITVSLKNVADSTVIYVPLQRTGISP